MKRSLSIGLLGLGLGVAFYGVSVSHSFRADVSRFFTGGPTDRATWLLFVGAAMIIAGAVGMLTTRRRRLAR